MTRAAPRRLVTLIWSGGDGVPIGRMLGAGAVVWALYSAIHLGLHGPVLDETVPAAQVIAGTVRYPAGHPEATFYRHVFSLSYNLAALAWAATRSVGGVSAVRNLGFLFYSAFVPYAVTVVLTRRPLWGHVAAVLTLSETACSFVGVYLSWVFPSFYSSGHVGIHVAALIAVLLVGGLWRTGGLLLGLLPGLHLAMALVVWPWAACYGLWAGRGTVDRRRVVAPLLVGLAVCAALGVAVRVRTSGDHPAPPYDATADGPVIRRTFIATTDPHRQPIHVVSAAYLVSPVAFAALGGLLLARGGRAGERAAAGWLLLLGAAVWGYVFGTRAFQAAMGWLPAAVETSMPGRYANLAGIFLLPFTVAALAGAAEAAEAAVGVAVAALVAVLLLGEAGLLAFARPLGFRFLIYVAWGVLFAVDAFAHRADGRRRAIGLVGFAALAAAVLALGREGLPALAALLGAAGVATLVLQVAVPRLRGRVLAGGHGGTETLLVVALVVAACAALPGTPVVSGWDAASEHISPYEHRLDAWLGAHAGPGDMLLTPLWPPTLLQAKTGHPVLIDVVALLTMTYMPELGPPTAAMVRELFGVDYARPEQLKPLLGPDGLLRPSSPVWLAAWRTRTCVEWQRLRDRWDFRFVLSPAATPLRLPAALPGDRWTLYAVPAPGECEDVPG